MAENLYCMVKGCNNKDHKSLHICKKHFYKLPKEKREQLEAMKVVSSMGQIDTTKFFFFAREVCQSLEPKIIIASPKPLSTRQTINNYPLIRITVDKNITNLSN